MRIEILPKILKFKTKLKIFSKLIDKRTKLIYEQILVGICIRKWCIFWLIYYVKDWEEKWWGGEIVRSN